MVVDSYALGTKYSSNHRVINLFGHQIVMDVPISALILAAIGAFFLAKILVQWLTFFAETFLFSGMSLNRFGAKKGKWAVVTGCTSGIGESFAHQLAKAGFNILLVSRTESSLQKMEDELAAKYKVQTKHVAVDLAVPGQVQDDAFESIKGILQGIQVGVLVNNAGASTDMPTPFVLSSEQENENILQVNIRSLLRMTSLVCPQMISNKNGLILNIGSFAGIVPSPYLPVYSASKAFVSHFSQAFGNEVKDTGVVVRCVVPAFVVSKMSKVRQSILNPTPDPYVASALASIGLQRGCQGIPYQSDPYWSHAVQDMVVRSLPQSLQIFISGNIMRKERLRALRRAERQKLKTQ